MLKVLIPTDFSPNAWNASIYALNLLKEEECKFFILHTYTIPFYSGDYATAESIETIVESYEDEMKKKVLGTIDFLLLHFSNTKHTYTALTRYNLLTDEINECCTKEKIDLIVMGTKGATGAKGILFGTNTVFVLRKVRVPVLAIPENYHFKPLSQLLLASDYLIFYKRRELKLLIKLAKMFNAGITVLHMGQDFMTSTEMEKNKAFLAECLTDVKHDFIEVIDTNLQKALGAYLESNTADVLVMMNRKRSFFEKIFTKQHIPKMGLTIKLPFLVLPDTGKLRN